MKKAFILLTILVILLAGCNENGTVVINTGGKYDFGKALGEMSSIDQKYGVVEGNVLPQNYESLIFDYDGLRSKLDSMDSSKDVNAAIKIVDFKINFYRSRDAMRRSSFQLGDDVCSRLDQFNNSYGNSTEAISFGRDSIAAIDDFIKNYPEYVKKIDSKTVLKMRNDIETEVNRLDSSTKSIKDYIGKTCE